MSERETALQECVFTVRTTSDVVNGRPVLQWASSCGQTWTPLEAVFDPRKRPTCPACEKPLRVAQRATDNPLAAQPVDAPQPCVWRDIATAPKDWTSVLVYDAESDEVGQAYYSMEDGGCDAWCWANLSDHDENGLVRNPTHWMPLPPVPAAQETTK